MSAGASNLPRRRSGPVQRERSKRTRQRVIRAAVACISEEGFKRTTATRIAERSGVSWGGIQHQFGGKEAILDAVLEHVLGEFERSVEKFSTRAATIEGRVRALVQASWELMLDPTYQAFREVMRNRATTGIAGLDAAAILARVEETLKPLRSGLFPELERTPRKLELVNVVLFATLSGMAEQQRYASVPRTLLDEQLAVLRETLVGLIEDS